MFAKKKCDQLQPIKEDRSSALTASTSLRQEIPRHIHFFWSGGKIPTDQFNNILSFLYNSLPSWQISIWTDRRQHIECRMNDYLMDCRRILVREFRPMADIAYEKMLSELNRNKEESESIKGSLRFAWIMLHRLALGATQPSSIKDLFVPLVLFAEGGYYFDVDSFAYDMLKSLEAPEGFLVLSNARMVQALASVPGHHFWIECLSKVEVGYRRIYRDIVNLPAFFPLDKLKDRSSEEHVASVLVTTGMFPEDAYNQRTKKYEDDYSIQDAYKARSNFVFYKPFNCACHPCPYKLDIGVDVREKPDDTSGWRRRKISKIVYDDNLSEESCPPLKRRQ